MIFLLRWKEEVDDESMEASCPEDIWFANQIQDNNCASLAMLNIIFNNPSAEIADQLAGFRQFTVNLTPPTRGLSLQNFEYLRKIHNSYARRSEIMQSNINVVDTVKSKRLSSEINDSEDESTYHFIAYLPMNEIVWELDGLKRQPVRLGAVSNDDWLLTAMPRIQHRISRYSENELMFTLLAITSKSPKNGIQKNLSNVEVANACCAAEDRQMASEKVENRSQSLEHQYAMRVKHPYSGFMRRYIRLLSEKGVSIGP